MKKFQWIALIMIVLINTSQAAAQEQEEMKGPPPAAVVTAKVTSGMVHPQTEFVGTVYFPEISEIASEVSGLVENIAFEEGQIVEKGQILVRLSIDLLQKDLDSAESDHDQVLANLENARKDFRRIETLFNMNSVSQKEYDKANFAMLALQNRASSIKAEVERLKLEIAKTRIGAPFHGVILERHADRGEWVSPGLPVATLARNDYMEVIVDVPQKILNFIKLGFEVEVTAGGGKTSGKVIAVIPRGDIATRTFPVKIAVKDAGSLAQGMEALVRLPSGDKTKAVLVPRDAVINAFGMSSVWIVREGIAQQVPVKVAAYDGMHAAVKAAGLTDGMDVIIKGNERLQPGQPVINKEQ